MRKSLVIQAVRPIFNIERPVVVFEVLGHEAIVRNPKQALIDLQNSGRALDVNINEFAGGIETVSPATRALFVQALFDCAGATLSADITVTKAGENYILSENHPLVVSGEAKAGETRVAEKGTVWVEGFMSIPLTMEEKLIRESAKAFSNTLSALFKGGIGLGATPAPAPAFTETPENTNSLPTATQAEAFGTPSEQSEAPKDKAGVK